MSRIIQNETVLNRTEKELVKVTSQTSQTDLFLLPRQKVNMTRQK